MGYYSLGFGMSSDRIFHMDKLRRLAQGRLSEILGEPALNVDKTMRNFGFEHLAKMIYMHMDNRTQRIIQDFCDGINDYPFYFSEGIEYWVLGTQFEKWKPEDSLSIYIFMQYAMTQSDEVFRDFIYSKIQDEDIVDRLIPFHPSNEIKGAKAVFTDEELKKFGFYEKDGQKPKPYSEKRKIFEFIEDNLEEEFRVIDEIKNSFSSSEGASNCWAVSGKHTKSGKPMLMNDPHLDPAMPSPFYLAELNINDEYIVGALLPGVPAFISARTKNIAYGVTSLNADLIDYFEEKIEGDKYLFKGKWEPLQIRDEVITIRDADPVTLQVRSTHHGPILDHKGAIMGAIDSKEPPLKIKQTISMQWSGYDYENHFIQEFFNILDKENVHEVIESFRDTSGGAFGLCMADRHDNIGYFPFAKFPKRDDIYAASKGIKPGWTGKYDWKGYADFKDIPFMVNPDKGYIFTANGRVSSDNVKLGMGVTQAVSARANRIDYLLNDLIHVQKKKIDIDDMKTVMNDTFDIFASLKAPIMIQLAEANLEKYMKDKSRIPQIKKWISELKAWDYRFELEVSQPTIFTLWDIYFVDNMFKRQIKNDKLRNHASKRLGFEDFTLNILENLQTDPNYFSKYCQSGMKDEPNSCIKALVDGLDFVHEYLVIPGTTFTNEDAFYKDWHKVVYRYAPFTRSFLRYFFDRSDSDSGSKNTINVGSVYYSDFKEKGLESQHTPNYRMIVDFGNNANNQFSIETGCSENILGRYFYYNLHDRHMSLEMVPMNFNSLNTTHTKRYATIRFIFKDWYNQEEERLRKLEEAKQDSGKTNEDL
jgi:penicillin amidase